jgi:hypothetical protein
MEQWLQNSRESIYPFTACSQQAQTSMIMWCLRTQKKIHAIASQHYTKTPPKNTEYVARIEVLTALLMRI